MRKTYIALVFALTFLEAQTFVDTTTRLEWQDDASVKKDWQGAIAYCKNLSLEGKSDWRLPSIEELLSITDDTKYHPAIKSGFKNVVSDGYWSSSSGASGVDLAWYVRFDDGGGSTDDKSYEGYVRCVRDSDTLSIDSFATLYEGVLEQTMASLPKPPLQSELKRGQFEKSSEFEKRVAQTKEKNAQALRQYEHDYKAHFPKAKREAMQRALEIYYGKPIVSELSYDADNELFGAKVSFENNQDIKHNLLLKMPPSEAEQFYASFGTLTPAALFEHDGQSVRLQSIKFNHAKKEYLAQLTEQQLSAQTLQVAQLDAMTPNMSSVSTNVAIAKSQYASFDASQLQSRNDLEELLAKAKAAPKDKKKWLFVLGLEKYKYTDDIAFATRSAQMFAKVAQKTLGVPEQNSFVVLNENATAQEIKTKMKLMLRRVKAGDTIYFYYNGHGVPAVDKANEPFILSSDMMPDFVSDESAFMMKNIYKELSASEASRVVAFVDSCFSGSTDGKSVQKGVAATRIKPKSIEFDKSKMVVLSAGRDTQYSSAYTQKAHRMFSFFVMQELLKGERNIQELYGKVYKQTKETTRENYGDMRLQEPTLDGNEKIEL
jgi:hypothetical protein